MQRRKFVGFKYEFLKSFTPLTHCEKRENQANNVATKAFSSSSRFACRNSFFSFYWCSTRPSFEENLLFTFCLLPFLVSLRFNCNFFCKFFFFGLEPPFKMTCELTKQLHALSIVILINIPIAFTI